MKIPTAPRSHQQRPTKAAGLPALVQLLRHSDRLLYVVTALSLWCSRRRVPQRLDLLNGSVIDPPGCSVAPSPGLDGGLCHPVVVA
jgi:hypothetical protein